MPLHTVVPSLHDNTHTPFAVWEDLFTKEDFEQIDLITKAIDSKKGTIMDKSVEESKKIARDSDIKWINATPENYWLFRKLSTIATIINDRFYRFDLSGMYEAIQHTTYDQNQHYSWHVDSGVMDSYNVVPRKISLTVQLSDSDEYEGGDLEIWTSGKSDVAPRKKGMVVAFPSFRLHRVTPITKGVRKSLVVWVGGPNFR